MREVNINEYDKKWLFTVEGEGGGEVVLLCREPFVVRVKFEVPLHWSQNSPRVWTQILETLDKAKECFPEISNWDSIHMPNLYDAPKREWCIILTPTKEQRNTKVTRLILPD